MSNPYLIEQPFVVSFSGGRTSGYMLRQILDAHGGTMPKDSAVLFANTGKERPETLDFVERCSQRWGVEIVWIEYRISESDEHSYAVVDYGSASRNGEPFEQVIEYYRRYRLGRETGGNAILPNPVQRFCTATAKLRPMKRYTREKLGWENWSDAVGLRADEPRRVSKLKGDRSYIELIAPLAAAGVTEEAVMRFWAAQPFDLQLQQHEGNCDLCFLKSAPKILRIMRSRPDLAAWWIEQEKATGATFRNDRKNYAGMLAQSRETTLLDLIDDDTPDCRCTD